MENDYSLLFARHSDNDNKSHDPMLLYGFINSAGIALNKRPLVAEIA